MKYLRIILACAAEPWALKREKLDAILQFLAFKAEGGMLEAQKVAVVTDARRDPQPMSAGSVAILPIYGTIMQRAGGMDEISGATSIERLQAQFRALIKNDDIKAIVLNVDSPGGSVKGVDEFAAEILEARGIKPIVAQIDSDAHSAAFWLASAADRIVVTPGGMAGSIGVFGVHDDISKMLDRIGVKKTVIASSEEKVEGLPFGPLSDEAKAELQKRVDEAAMMFMERVAEGRGVTRAAVKDRFGNGRSFGARELVSRGMADEIAPLRATLEKLGVQLSPKRTAAADVRRALNAGQLPTVRQFEGALGDLGFSNTQAETVAGHGLRKLLEGDPQAAPAGDPQTEANATGIARVTADIGALARDFKLPSFTR